MWLDITSTLVQIRSIVIFLSLIYLPVCSRFWFVKFSWACSLPEADLAFRIYLIFIYLFISTVVSSGTLLYHHLWGISNQLDIILPYTVMASYNNCASEMYNIVFPISIRCPTLRQKVERSWRPFSGSSEMDSTSRYKIWLKWYPWIYDDARRRVEHTKTISFECHDLNILSDDS